MKSRMRPSFDHLVGERKKLVRYVEGKRFSGPEIDHKLESGWLDDRQIGGFVVPEDEPSIDTGMAAGIENRACVGDQSTGRDVVAPRINGWQTVTCRQRHEWIAELAAE